MGRCSELCEEIFRNKNIQLIHETLVFTQTKQNETK